MHRARYECEVRWTGGLPLMPTEPVMGLCHWCQARGLYRELDAAGPACKCHHEYCETE